MKKIARAIPKMEDGIIQQTITHSFKNSALRGSAACG
jgi:hypothetical protein